MKAPLPPNEAERLAALRRYLILDSSPEQDFDDLALLASQICQTPFAMISFVDEARQWFKARVGMKETETSRDVAFCAHTILKGDQVMEIRDAQADPRFNDNPLVTTGEKIRFYAGAPMVAPDGQALGALCVMDRKPRELTAEQQAALKALSRHAVARMELRRQAELLGSEVDAREKAQRELREHLEKLQRSQEDATRLLNQAERSRRSLLSVLEDEKRAGQNLRESEERFRQLVENIREVFWLREVPNGRLIYMSPAYEQIWGRPLTSSDDWLESVHPDDKPRVADAAATRQAAGTYDEIFRIIRPDGAVLWVHARAFPVQDADGKVRRIAGVAEDITERKKLEEQFLHAQRMEAIGALASGVAHDLNNILAPMLMIAGLLKETVAGTKEREMLALMELNGQRGAGIVRQLLAFSRSVPGVRVIVQPKHLVRDMVQIMRETFPRNIQISEYLAPDLSTIEADATQLHQVLMNLCVNARDAMPNGGSIAVEAQNVAVTPQLPVDPSLKPGPYVCLKVKDSGGGIPPEVIGRIFEPFFTTKEVGKGTGLGLSTVVGIVKAHEGVVKVESKVGKGTTFEVYLPAATREEPLPVIGDAAKPRGRGEMVLVVDDETPILKTMKDFLQHHGYRVLGATSGEEAMKLFIAQQGAVRLVLTDVMMPGMGGVGLVRALRNLDPSVRILVASGLKEELNEEELLAMGVTKVLPKPFPALQLLKEMRVALGH